MKVFCPGCGREYTCQTEESFTCGLCGTEINPARRGRGVNAAVDVPEGIRRFAQKQMRQESAPAWLSGAQPWSSGAQSWSSGEFRFENCPGGARVCGMAREMADVVVPEEWNGRRVVEIGERAFRGENVETVRLPESVALIGAAAFENCAQLREVSGGAPGLRIEAQAFHNCVRLTGLRFSGRPAADITAFAGCFELGLAQENVDYRRSDR